MYSWISSSWLREVSGSWILIGGLPWKCTVRVSLVICAFLKFFKWWNSGFLPSSKCPGSCSRRMRRWLVSQAEPFASLKIRNIVSPGKNTFP